MNRGNTGHTVLTKWDNGCFWTVVTPNRKYRQMRFQKIYSIAQDIVCNYDDEDLNEMRITRS